MSWEQDISKKLQELQDISVRFDIDQELTETEKARARSNISIGSSATVITGNDYKITLE